jgi:drug/metabolite transporter (DMT)-like permease
MTTQHGLRTELPLLALLALLWGSSYLFIKVAVTEIPPVALIALRVTGAAGFLLVVMRLRGERLPQDWRTRRMVLLYRPPSTASAHGPCSPGVSSLWTPVSRAS